jgi:hypothetical protein
VNSLVYRVVEEQFFRVRKKRALSDLKSIRRLDWLNAFDGRNGKQEQGRIRFTQESGLEVARCAA